MERAALDKIASVLVSSDLRRTAEYYRDVLGFELVENYENVEPFATLYRDSDELAGVDLFYEELLERGACIAAAPAMTPYGSYEFVLEDIDGRRIGIGRIKDEGVFFKSRSQ